MDEKPQPQAQPKSKVKQCMFVLYPESQQSIIDYCMENLPCAWALHDKDTYTHDSEDGSYKTGDLKKPHYHFVCRFPNPRYFSGIAKEIGVPVNVINRCNSLYKAYVYLWHKDTPDKYQYDSDIVGVHDFDPPTENGGLGNEEDVQVKALIEMPFEQFETTADMARWAYENGCWSTFKSSYALWRDIRREMKCIQICGGFGSYGSNAQHPDNPFPGSTPISIPNQYSFEEIVQLKMR